MLSLIPQQLHIYNRSIFSDFLIKIVDVETNEQKLFQEHEAPILSLAVHPLETYLVCIV